MLRAPQAQTAKAVGDEPDPAPRGLIILVNFQDSEFKTPKDTIDSMLNAENFTRRYKYRSFATGLPRNTTVTSSGSARKYFQDQSYGAYNPRFDVVGPVTVSEKAEYYGGNDDANAPMMIIEACELVDDSVDFKNYDHDGDGYVDFVYVIYAGYGEADSGMDSVVWPHAWDVSWYGYHHDGKYIGRYACGCEMNYISKVYDGIGTFCHEFSHVLGLPDLYCTSSSGTAPHTLNDWDIMDYGPYNNDGNTPPAYSAYERFYMGWLTPRLLTDPEYVTLPLLNETGEALVMNLSDSHPTKGWDPRPTVFYLLETRTKSGWDKYLPGSGMLITKVNYSSYKWQNNSVNNNARSMGVDIIEAKENTGNWGSSTDAFPAGATEWTGLTNHEVTEITRNTADGSVSFSFRGAPKPMPQAIEMPEGAVKVQKTLHDGQVLIVRDGKIYDILGRAL